jgi:hypothetical protein
MLPIQSQLFEKSSIAPFNPSHAIYLKRGRIRPIWGQTKGDASIPREPGGFWPLHCVTGGGMEKRQITRQELVAAALKLGARPGTIRQWFHRAVPYRWQIRLMEYFEGPVEISDWAPEATAAIAKPSIAETWRKKHPVSS